MLTDKPLYCFKELFFNGDANVVGIEENIYWSPTFHAGFYSQQYMILFWSLNQLRPGLVSAHTPRCVVSHESYGKLNTT